MRRTSLKRIMKKWFISMELVNRLPTYGGKNMLWSRKGQIGLYCKNEMKTFYFKNPTESPTRLGWIAERKNCPSYFKQVIIEC